MSNDQVGPVTFGRSSIQPWVDREPPATARGVRTRNALVAAARTVFERDGFINARLHDITAEAACSIGTFYTYFDTKEEILAAVLEAVQQDMMHPGLPRVPEENESIRTVLEASNRAYLEAYRRNARLMMLLEQVATLDARFAELRLLRARTFAERNAQKIAQLQEAGLADRTLDPMTTAWILGSMISRVAYLGLVLGEPFEWDEVISTLTTLWLHALGIRDQTA